MNTRKRREKNRRNRLRARIRMALCTFRNDPHLEARYLAFCYLVAVRRIAL